MRRRSTLLPLLCAAACWLAAGPGFVGLEAALLCHHHYGAMGHRHGHPMPADGPCFCDQMVGSLDTAAADVLPAAPAVLAITVARFVPASDVSRFPLPPSPTFSPETPPPNAAA